MSQRKTVTFDDETYKFLKRIQSELVGSGEEELDATTFTDVVGATIVQAAAWRGGHDKEVDPVLAARYYLEHDEVPPDLEPIMGDLGEMAGSDVLDVDEELWRDDHVLSLPEEGDLGHKMTK